MFGLGLTEIGIILVLLILFIKPDDVPGFIRKIGKTIGWIRKLTSDAKSLYQDAEREMLEVEDETEKHDTDNQAVKSDSEIKEKPEEE